jgi:hypothetical protein
MFDTISKGELNPSKFSYDSSSSNSNSSSYTAIDLLPTEMQFNAADNNNSNFKLDTSTKDVMKDELKSFLKKQMNTGAINNELSSSPGY